MTRKPSETQTEGMAGMDSAAMLLEPTEATLDEPRDRYRTCPRSASRLGQGDPGTRTGDARTRPVRGTPARDLPRRRETSRRVRVRRRSGPPRTGERHRHTAPPLELSPARTAPATRRPGSSSTTPYANGRTHGKAAPPRPWRKHSAGSRPSPKCWPTRSTSYVARWRSPHLSKPPRWFRPFAARPEHGDGCSRAKVRTVVISGIAERPSPAPNF